MLAAGGFTVIFGPSGSGKSFLTFDLSASLAACLPTWYGYDFTPCRVLYVALEGENGQRRRVLAWQQHTGRPCPKGCAWCAGNRSTCAASPTSTT